VSQDDERGALDDIYFNARGRRQADPFVFRLLVVAVRVLDANWQSEIANDRAADRGRDIELGKLCIVLGGGQLLLAGE
jgi:hypothetical protein